MTNNEINKILSFLEKEDIGKLKIFLQKTKEKNDAILLQRTFEKYITNDGKSILSDIAKKGTYLDFNEDKLMFTNGISIYNLNKNIFNLDSPKIVKNSTSYGVHAIHKINVNSKDTLLSYLYKVKKMINELYPVFREEELNKFVIELRAKEPMFFEYYHVFSIKEYETAKIILGNPEFNLDTKIPLLHGKSERGEVYILGLRK